VSEASECATLLNSAYSSVGILLYRTMQATQAIQDPLHDTTQTNTLPTISIYHPRLSRPQNQYPPQSQPASHLNTRNPIILYLGAWPSSQSSINQASIKDSARAQTLAHSANATVVQVHYRDCTYPQPVHDVLAAWDWIGAQLGRDGMKLGGGEGGAEGKGGSMGMGMGMGVYGNEVGGSLALMLGMTECDAGVSEVAQPSMHDHGAATGRASPETGKPHIRAVAVHDPIVDWVFPQAELDSDAPPATSAGSAPTSNLIALRAQAFRASTHPSSYFDPFASPIHFLRTPSAAIPPATVSYTSTPPAETSGNGKAVDDEFDVLARLEEETLSSLRPLLVSEGSQTQTQTLTQSQMQIPTPPSTASVSGPASGITEETLYIDTTVRRKVPLRWPPSSLPRTARMPWFSITVSEDDPPLRDTEAASTAQPNPLLAQVTEMARLLRRAYVKYCLPREFGREEEHEGTDAADLRSLVRAGDKVVEDRVLRDIMASEADNLSSDTKSKSGSRRKKREVQDTEEDEHERALRQRISTVRRLARERVVFEVVPGRGDGVGNGEEECEDEEQGMDADEQQRKGRRPYVQDAAEEEEEMDEMAETREMDEIEKVGRWMGEMLRR